MARREGLYQNWEWDDVRKCWVSYIPCRVYPRKGGKFTASYADAWIDGIFDDFESAEKAALGISTE